MKTFEKKVTYVDNDTYQQTQKQRKIEGRELRPKKSRTQIEDCKTEKTYTKSQKQKEEYTKKKLRLNSHIEKQIFRMEYQNPIAFSTNESVTTNNNFQRQAMSANYQYMNNPNSSTNLHSVNLHNNIVYPQMHPQTPQQIKNNSNFSNYNQSV